MSDEQFSKKKAAILGEIDRARFYLQKAEVRIKRHLLRGTRAKAGAEE